MGWVMGEAAPQAAAVGSTVQRALEALRLDWDGVYMIGRDDERGWWAARHGRIGSVMTASEPDELRAAMAEDFGPVRS